MMALKVGDRVKLHCGGYQRLNFHFLMEHGRALLCEVPVVEVLPPYQGVPKYTVELPDKYRLEIDERDVKSATSAEVA